MAYLALYRKYRPQTFDDIMGQDHVTRTLQNAIRRNRVAHAYLFCGPRGTAKTTTARVLAKAMNCEHGPTPDPCDECDACIRIRDGHSLDVVEIDAASNRGIDDIKLLREQVGRASAQERTKFYIIDEVHQLSADAFQALLKTLEEPPPNVLFVLATTETHRVPKTIVSRCQRFDFRRGTMKDLTDRLRYVVDAEGMTADPEALTAIARASAGGWRDALSLLEQMAAYSPETVDLAAVNAVLGSVEESALSELADALAERDAATLFRIIERLVAEGKEPRLLLSSVGAYLRDLLWAQSGAGDAAQLSPEAATRCREQAERMPPGLLMGALEAINRAESQMRWVSDHRLLLELTLLRIASGHPVETPAAPPSAPAPVTPSARNPEPPTKAEAPRAKTPRSAPATAPPPLAEEEPSASAPAAPVREASAPVEPDSEPEEEFAHPDESVEGGLEELWERVLGRLKPKVRGLLRGATPLGISGKMFRVGFRYKAHIELLNQKENKREAEAALQEVFGQPLLVKGEEWSGAAPPKESGPSADQATASDKLTDSTSRAAPKDGGAPRPSPGGKAAKPADDDFITEQEFADLFHAEKIEGDD